MNSSQTTLVNYSTPDVLLFSKDSMVSTKIFYQPYEGSSKTLYTVSMNGTAGDRVEVHDHRGNAVAVMKWKTLSRDTIFFPQVEGQKDVLRGKVMAWDKWLVPTHAEDGNPIHTLTIDGDQFIFRTDSKHRLAMYYASDHWQVEPLAELTLQSSLESPTKITLHSNSLAQHRDMVLVAFLMLEQRTRLREKRWQAPPGTYWDPLGCIKP